MVAVLAAVPAAPLGAAAPPSDASDDPMAHLRVVGADGAARTVDRLDAAWEDGRLRVSVQDGRPGAAYLRIDRAWADARLPDLATSRPHAATPDGRAYLVPLEGGREAQSVTLGSFSPQKGATIHSLGSAQTVRLAARPMGITLLEVPHEETRAETVTNANGTFVQERLHRVQVLAIDYSDGDPSGQRLHYDAAWLRGMGFQLPAFRYEDGSPIPSRLVGDAYEVDAPHFSTIYTFDSSNEGFSQQNAQPYSEITWDGTNKRVSVYVDRGDPGDELYQRSLPSQYGTGTTFSVTSRWATTTQGNWQAAFPLFLCGSGATDVHNNAGCAYIYYYSRDSNVGDAPIYALRYRDAAGVLRIAQDYAGAVNTEYRFSIAYDGPTKVMTMKVRSAANVDLKTASYTVGTYANDGFAFDKVGVASDGWGGSGEPRVNAWADDITLGGGGSGGAYSEAFDASSALPSGWSLSANALWHVSSKRPSSPANSLWYGIESSNNFETGGTNAGEAWSASFNVPSSGPTLTLKSYYDTETGGYYDRKFIEITTNNGASWRLLEEITSDPTLTWVSKSYSLASEAGASARLRFRFDSVDGVSNGGQGWFIDDIAVGSTSGGNNLPSACINPPSVSGRTISVTSCSTDPDGDALTHAWNWGDGTPTSSGASASHTYACPGGAYTLQLTVNDGRGGTNSATRSVSTSEPDSDSDGIVDCRETGTYGTNPNVADTDGDGIIDGTELNRWNAYSSTLWNTNVNRSGVGGTNNLLKYDADGDGLRDGIEFDPPTSIFGTCANIGGRNECPTPFERDVYVQLNWMAHNPSCTDLICNIGRHSHAPSASEIQTFRDNFANYNNAAGRQGNDILRVHLYVGAAGDGNGAVNMHVDQIEFRTVAGDWNDIYDYKSAVFPAARKGYFYFSFFGHDITYQGGATGGIAHLHGDDNAVSHSRTTTSTAVLGVWMQELGHNLLGNNHMVCNGAGGHNHGHAHNPDATHLRFVDFPGVVAYDEGRNSDGACGATVRDGQQDVFAHSTQTNDAMGYGYVTGNLATTYSPESWLDMRPWVAMTLSRLGVDTDVSSQPHDHDSPEDHVHDLLAYLTPSALTSALDLEALP